MFRVGLETKFYTALLLNGYLHILLSCTSIPTDAEYGMQCLKQCAEWDREHPTNDQHYRILDILHYPDNGLWFLYNLFVYCLIFNLSERLSDILKCRQELALALFYTIILIAGALLRKDFNASQICWYFPFFAIGYYIRKYPSVMQNKLITLVAGGGIL